MAMRFTSLQRSKSTDTTGAPDRTPKIGLGLPLTYRLLVEPRVELPAAVAAPLHYRFRVEAQ